jgi:hypothetical protein
MKPLHLFLDRTAVLFIGIGAGAAIASGFYEAGGETSHPALAAADAPKTGKAQPKAAACSTRLDLSPELRVALAQGESIDVGVFGDSFGDGIWAGLYNEFRDVPNMTVHRFTKQSTGFTRYNSLNLLDDAAEKLAGQPVDLAVISFGANDTFDIWEEGQLMPYMSKDWKRFIGERIRTYIEQLRDSGAQVVWVGLPAMRKPAFDQQIGQMNDFNEELMCELNVPFIDTLPKSVDDKGNYTESLQQGGKGPPIKARAGDGIHMTMTGYRILVEDMTQNIRAAIPKPGKAKPDKQAGKNKKDGSTAAAK